MKLQGTMEIKDNVLHIGGVNTLDLVKKYKTPLYVFDEELIRSKCREYIKSFKVKENGNKVAYAGKAFLTKYMCKLVCEEGLCLDVVSGGELYTAYKAGMPMENILFHGNNKTIDEVKLGMIKARLMKMADITDFMLTSLNTSVLEVEREPIDLQLELEMITEMFTMIRKHARVEYHIAEGLGYPCLDKIYFNYIVINLVDNAIKYGGAHPVVKINFYEEGTDYILVVEDNGMGIAPKDQKQIFKQFYRVRNQQVTKTTGFGLGLTFVHKVVCAYGGKIHIESEIGNGSKFLIILPQVSWKN